MHYQHKICGCKVMVFFLFAYYKDMHKGKCSMRDRKVNQTGFLGKSQISKSNQVKPNKFWLLFFTRAVKSPQQFGIPILGQDTASADLELSDV